MDFTNRYYRTAGPEWVHLGWVSGLRSPKIELEWGMQKMHGPISSLIKWILSTTSQN